MNQNLVLYTCMGGLKLTYLQNLADYFVINKSESDLVSYASTGRMPQVMSYIPGFPAAESVHERKDIKLKEIASISNIQLVNFLGNLYELKMDVCRQGIQKLVADRFKTLVAHKRPDFFVKDLNIQTINDLTERYIGKNYDTDAIGVHIDLGPNQKFFLIIDPNDFVVFLHETRRIDKDDTAFMAELVDTKGGRWVMGRYENLEYLKELTAMQMRTGAIK